MQFFYTDDEGKRKAFPVRVKKAIDYKALYSHGAFGGFLSNYHFRIDFYVEEVPPLEYTEVDGQPDEKELRERGMERTVQASVYCPLPFLKELSEWLNKNIKEYEEQFGEIPKTVGTFAMSDTPEGKGP